MLSRPFMGLCRRVLHAVFRTILEKVHCNCMERISKKGQTYIKGRAVESDLRRIVIDDIISAGRCPETAYFPGEFKYVADKFELRNTTIKNFADFVTCE